MLEQGTSSSSIATVILCSFAYIVQSMDRHWTPKPSQLSTETFASLAAINPSISHSPSRTARQEERKDSSPKGPGFESWCGNVCDSPRNASLAASAARSPPIMERSHQPPTTYRHHIWLVPTQKTRNSHMLDDQNVFNATNFLSYKLRQLLVANQGATSSSLRTGFAATFEIVTTWLHHIPDDRGAQLTLVFTMLSLLSFFFISLARTIVHRLPWQAETLGRTNRAPACLNSRPISLRCVQPWCAANPPRASPTTCVKPHLCKILYGLSVGPGGRRGLRTTLGNASWNARTSWLLVGGGAGVAVAFVVGVKCWVTSSERLGRSGRAGARARSAAWTRT